MVESPAGRSRRRGGPDADEAVIASLADDGFVGPKYLLAEMKLAVHGVHDMTTRIREGEVFSDCARIGRRLPRSELQIRATSSWETARELASSTVIAALPFFRRSALVGGGWLPSGGASIKRYFTGACVLAFPNVYRTWRNEFWNLGREVRYGLMPEEAILCGTARDPADTVLFAASFQDLVRDLPADTAYALKRIVFEGASLREVAGECGMTENALQKRLKKLSKSKNWMLLERENR